ncbi:hypothetical protein PN36_31385 [Candidatus Thiomargarita nelsonii]|uniref:Uncharacterized protein n=1 Tax=Candidatus Thiomargarita nelsonii TaxID=1003181 RepID=A0A0A6PD46_9GAMM|nr:hypothetical protein PN36_31385 [Candidatus Thiomargarita nelsonii]
MSDLHRRIIVGIFTACVCSGSFAATVVERNEMGKIQKIILDEHAARIDSSVSNYYTLLYLDKGKAYMVNTKEKRIVEMNIIGTPPKLPQNMPPWQARRDRPSQKAELVKKGNGPSIDGYPTINYQVKTNGQLCSENYFSKKAAQVPYLKAFIRAMSDMTNSRKIKGMPVHPCQKAHDDLAAESMSLGFPMKSVVKMDKRGGVRFEIISIKTDVDVSADTFTLPKRGYDVISEQQMIAEGQAKMRQWMEESKQRRGH